MRAKLDLSKEYGVVLEGGGARGSYQIGAWQALREAGIKIKAVAGASVGALNGALICMDEYEKAKKIWMNIDASQVMNRNDDKLKQVRQLVFERGFDISPLKQMITDYVDEEKLRNSEMDLYVTTFSLTDLKLLKVNVKDVPDGQIPEILLASAYFPAFRLEKMSGKTYLDGGGFNNVPVDVLIENGYKDIIIIRIYGLGFDSEKVVEIPEDTNVYHIAPRQDLGGILEFDKRKCRRNMKLGYLDGMRSIYGLYGKKYYIYAPEGEVYYFNRLISELETWKKMIKYLLPEIDNYDMQDGYRYYMEKIFPELAKNYKLNENWDYKDLYIAIIENLAREMKISRLCIYSAKELISRIKEKICRLDSGELM